MKPKCLPDDRPEVFGVKERLQGRKWSKWQESAGRTFMEKIGPEVGYKERVGFRQGWERGNRMSAETSAGGVASAGLPCAATAWSPSAPHQPRPTPSQLPAAQSHLSPGKSSSKHFNPPIKTSEADLSFCPHADSLDYILNSHYGSLEVFLLSRENSEKLLVPDQPAPTSLPGNLLQMYILHPTPHPLGQKLCGGGEERGTHPSVW